MGDDGQKPRGVKNPILNLIIKLVDSGALHVMPGGVFKVLGVLLAHRNPGSGTCWPSIKTIERESGVGRRQVFRALSWLYACGLIDKKRGPAKINFVNVYQPILNPHINIPPTLRKRSKMIGGGCHNSTTEGGGRKGQKKARSDTQVTPLLGDTSDTHLLGDKTAPQKDLKYLGSIKKKSKHTISKKTIEELRALKGDKWVKEEIKRRGYVIEEDSTNEKEMSTILTGR